MNLNVFNIRVWVYVGHKHTSPRPSWSSRLLRSPPRECDSKPAEMYKISKLFTLETVVSTDLLVDLEVEILEVEI